MRSSSHLSPPRTRRTPENKHAPRSFQAPTDLVLTVRISSYPPVCKVSLLRYASRFALPYGRISQPLAKPCRYRPTATRDASCPCHPEKRRLTLIIPAEVPRTIKCYQREPTHPRARLSNALRPEATKPARSSPSSFRALERRTMIIPGYDVSVAALAKAVCGTSLMRACRPQEQT